MDENTIVDQLEELAEKFGIQIRYEPIKQDEDLVRVVGGLCILRGEYVVIIDSKAAMKDKIRTLAEAITHFDLDQIYIKPALREIIRKIPASSNKFTIEEESL
jgi:fructose-specific component phosphotransferase system IIB-like protein